MSDPYGECVLTLIHDVVNGTQVRVERADPVVRIAPSLLASVPPPGSGWPTSFDGKVLRIDGVNQKVVYRIRDILEPVPGQFGHWDYIGEWPD